jgi:hypothetical protein
MPHAERVIEQTLALVAKSKANRERYERERRETFSRIQIGRDLGTYLIKPGQQLSLKLDS